MAEYPWLIFRLQGDNYAINSENISAINKLEHSEISGVPNSPAAICGVVNFRGNIIPLMDLRVLYHMEPGKKEMMVVIDQQGRQFGLVVDEVLAVEDIKQEEKDQEDLKGMFSGNCIQAVGKRYQDESLVMLLDEEKLSSQVEQVQL